MDDRSISKKLRNRLVESFLYASDSVSIVSCNKLGSLLWQECVHEDHESHIQRARWVGDQKLHLRHIHQVFQGRGHEQETDWGGFPGFWIAKPIQIRKARVGLRTRPTVWFCFKWDPGARVWGRGYKRAYKNNSDFREVYIYGAVLWVPGSFIPILEITDYSLRWNESPPRNRKSREANNRVYLRKQS